LHADREVEVAALALLAEGRFAPEALLAVGLLASGVLVPLLLGEDLFLLVLVFLEASLAHEGAVLERPVILGAGERVVAGGRGHRAFGREAGLGVEQGEGVEAG